MYKITRTYVSEGAHNPWATTEMIIETGHEALNHMIHTVGRYAFLTDKEMPVTSLPEVYALFWNDNLAAKLNCYITIERINQS